MGGKGLTYAFAELLCCFVISVELPNRRQVLQISKLAWPSGKVV